MTPKRQRLWMMIAGLLVMAIGVTLILRNFQDHLVYFYTPTQLEEKQPQAGEPIRLGGLVKLESVTPTGAQSMTFIVTDFTHEVSVAYTGVLPALFREGQGVVAEGTLDAQGVMQAKTILAKHDEYYMPPEVAKQLKESGQWEHYQPQYNITPKE